MDPRREALIEEHLPLVDHVVRKVAGSFPAFVDHQELMAAGRLGLTEAASRFDFDHGVPFAPYATRRIRGAVLDLMRSNDWVPRRVRELGRHLDRVEAKLIDQHGRRPLEEELASAAGVGLRELRETTAALIHGGVTTLERPTEDGDHHDALVDPTVMGIEELLEQRELQGYLRAALDNLPERLRTIVVGLYLEGKTVGELAELCGVTPSRVSQLRADAMEIIRDGIESQFRPKDPERAKGRVAIRRARYAAAIATHSDWRTRLLSAGYQDHQPRPTHGPLHDGVEESA